MDDDSIVLDEIRSSDTLQVPMIMYTYLEKLTLRIF